MLLSDVIQRALAIDPAPGSTWMDAEHVVILMQENRSFDHLYGTLQGSAALMIRGQSHCRTAIQSGSRPTRTEKPLPPSA